VSDRPVSTAHRTVTHRE